VLLLLLRWMGKVWNPGLEAASLTTVGVGGHERPGIQLPPTPNRRIISDLQLRAASVLIQEFNDTICLDGGEREKTLPHTKKKEKKRETNTRLMPSLFYNSPIKKEASITRCAYLWNGHPTVCHRTVSRSESNSLADQKRGTYADAVAVWTSTLLPNLSQFTKWYVGVYPDRVAQCHRR
jgi:hypothetical protein